MVPPPTPDADYLSSRQREIMKFIHEFSLDKGYPPSVREIGEAVGLSSPSTVHNHLRQLKEGGYLRADPSKPRTIELRWEPQSGALTDRQPVRNVPLVGRIAAGTPVLAAEHVEEVYPMPHEFVGDGTVFMLQVAGDSMIDAGILDGDFVVIRERASAKNGEIVAALINGEEATVKRFYREGDKVILRPANPALEERVYTEGVEVIGPVVSVLRKV